MKHLIRELYDDEAGFILSAELILVSTIAVLSMVVGLSELAENVNQELEDVASAFASINQSFEYEGHEGHKGWFPGSSFNDGIDFCDDDCDIRSSPPVGEL